MALIDLSNIPWNWEELRMAKMPAVTALALEGEEERLGAGVPCSELVWGLYLFGWELLQARELE